MSTPALIDLLVIGGGINGTAVARDAAGRGLSVLLCERDDLASHTSSASTKLIHGGLRYLEYYEFRLVRESLKEREVLLRAAPHIIWPMRFVLPYDEGLRPKWMLRAGLFLYDSLGGRDKLPGTETVKLDKAPHKGVLESRLTTGFEYSDCWVEDARLVVLNALDAQDRGADIRTRCAVTDLTHDGEHFLADLGDGSRVRAKAVVNAAGPWVEDVLGLTDRKKNESGLRLVKGSHIVTKRLFQGDHAYIFQNADDRIIFAIPYERDYTLIGTTDVPYQPSAKNGEWEVKASAEEIAYLCDATSEYLEHDITPADVQWTYSGVRPLYDDRSEDASAVTRDYVLQLDRMGDDIGGSPLLSVYGGKITTSRKLAEHVLEKLTDDFPGLGKSWTRTAHLPGGEIANADFDAFFAKLQAAHPDVEARQLHRLARAYGTRAAKILEDGLGRIFGAGVYGPGLCEAEVDYLIETEWAEAADDVLWRRTKLGLHMSADEITAFTQWFDARI